MSTLRFATRIVPLHLAFLVAVPLAACGGGDPAGTNGGDGGEPQVAVVDVTPGADTLTALGATRELEAVARDADGNEVSGASFTWSSSDEVVAAVDASGVVTAEGNGAAEITATTSGVSGTAELAVLQRVETVAVEPQSATLSTVGATQQFSASATDANGNAVEEAVFVWDSEDPTVATVDRDGLATSKGAGQTAVSATAQDVPAFAAVTVDQTADHLAFRTEPTTTLTGHAIDPAVQVEVLDADGNRVADAEIAVTIGIGTNPGGGALMGTKTVNATGGVATFSGIGVDVAAEGYTLVASAPGVTDGTSAAFDVNAPVVMYKDAPGWSRGEEIVLANAPFNFKVDRDYSVRPMADLQLGVPEKVRVVILPSNASGGDAQALAQNDPAAQTALDDFVTAGGWLLAHLGDNATEDYMIPGLTGVADETSSCSGLSLATFDHPLVRGPNELDGGGDDLDNANIDTTGGCSEVHGSLEGILPMGATVLINEQAGDTRPVYATYAHGSGQIVVSTITLEFLATLTTPVPTLRNHYYWALREAGARVHGAALAAGASQADPAMTVSGDTWISSTRKR